MVIGSYGLGRATLRAGAGATDILAYNAAGIELRDLDVQGPGWAQTDGAAVSFYTDLPAARRLAHVRVERLDCSGFYRGVVIGAWHPTYTGFDQVVLESLRVSRNATGILVYGYAPPVAVAAAPYSNRDVTIRGCQVFDNDGDPQATAGTGDGILVGEVDGALIEYCVASGNGKNGGGPIGIWTWDSNNVVIQHNISHGNKTGGPRDGGGFDLDGGVSNSVLQYNYSYDNAGAGFMLAQNATARPFADNTVRYNVSQNDARRNSAAIQIWAQDGAMAPMSNSQIYGNTVFVAPSRSIVPPALQIENGDVRATRVHNNIFVTTGGAPLVRVKAGVGSRFEGNAYHASGAGFRVEWFGQSFSSLATWRAVGQEMLTGSPVGFEGDPRLAAPGQEQPLQAPTALATLDEYRLLPDSPLREAGLDLAANYEIDPGARDFYGASIPAGSFYDVGAHEAVQSCELDLGYRGPGLGQLSVCRPTAALGPRTHLAQCAHVLAGWDPRTHASLDLGSDRPRCQWHLHHAGAAELWRPGQVDPANRLHGAGSGVRRDSVERGSGGRAAVVLSFTVNAAPTAARPRRSHTRSAASARAS